eukprot:1176608-Pyramimonas_sp.AAC.1
MDTEYNFWDFRLDENLCAAPVDVPQAILNGRLHLTDKSPPLPLEGKKFASVDRNWRKALGQAKVTPHVLSICNSKKLLEMFVEANKLLESVQKV